MFWIYSCHFVVFYMSPVSLLFTTLFYIKLFFFSVPFKFLLIFNFIFELFPLWLYLNISQSISG